MTRLGFVKKNIFASYVSQIIAALTSFVCRTIFIKELAAAYLGVNGLFSNVLGLLALAELGFGIAMNFEMYKPVAENDKEKIVSLLYVYRKVYHIIAIVVLVAGLAIVPFMSFLVKDPGDVGNIYVYYFLYLGMTVAGYFSSYLFCLTNAEQKEYISSVFSLCAAVTINFLQIIFLLIYKSFLVYLIIQFIVVIGNQIAIRIYFKHKYAYLYIIKPQKLDEATNNHIKKNMGGLIVSKFSDVLTHQTDNIIIALGLDIFAVGYADNYCLIANYIKKIVLALLTSVVPSLGNMAATEDIEKCYRVFKIYDFIDYLIYGFCTVMLISLYQPFISLWAGQEKLIDTASMVLLCASFYIAGRSHSFSNYKTAFGIFYDVKVTSIVCVALNLGISIIGVITVGLPGIYIGTCIAFTYSNIRTLRLAYEKITASSLKLYYLKRIIQVCVLVVPVVVLNMLALWIKPEQGWLSFIIYLFLSCAITMSWLAAIFYKTEEFCGVKALATEAIKKVLQKRVK